MLRQCSRATTGLSDLESNSRIGGNTMTNLEHIQSMPVERLAYYLRKLITPCEQCPCDATCPEDGEIDCAEMLLAWLKGEVKDDE
jgi:hypothetical protein